MRNLSTAFLGYYEKRFLRNDEVSRDYNHKGKGFDTVTFAAPVDFFWTKAPLGVVVKVSINGRGDKSFYIHEICDAEDNYIQMAGENSSKKTSSTNFVEPTSTVSAADGISPKTSIRNESDIIENEFAEAMDIVVDSDSESVDRLQEMFTEALVEASENFQSAEKNTTDDGGVKYSLNYDDAIDQLHAGTLDRTKNTHLKVLDNTPQVYIDKADAKDLKIIMGWDIAYLAMNKSGDLLGNYHGLGPDVMKAIPQALQDPLYIVKQDNGRIIAVTEIVVKGNRSTLVSIELGAFKSTTQDGENESDNYNLIVTIFDAKSNYLAKLMNNGEIVHNKNNEDPAHFILRLKSLNKALSDDDHAKSSNKDIAQDKVEVKNESAEAVGVEVDEKTESVAPEILMSERTWTESDYVQEYKDSHGDIHYSDRDYSYEALISKPDMKVTSVGGNVPTNRADVIAQAKKSATSVGRFDPKTGSINVHVKDIGKDIVIGTTGLEHGLDGGDVGRLRTNARLSAIGGLIVRNAVPVNGLKNKNRQANGTYAMACLLKSGDRDVVAVVTVEEHTSKAVGIDYVDITHSINGRLRKNSEGSLSSTRETGYGLTAAPSAATFKVSIAEFLEIVNDTHRSILSQNVLDHFDEERPADGH